MYPHLFSELSIQGLTLKNRIIMAPLYLAWAGEDGMVSEALLEHYQLMAKSGVAMVVAENASVAHPLGSGSNRTLRIDTDEAIHGLARLAKTIKAEGALACLQINHAGRFAYADQDSIAPSDITTFGRPSRGMSVEEIKQVIEQFGAAAKRVKAAGFDMVEWAACRLVTAFLPMNSCPMACNWRTPANLPESLPHVVLPIFR